MMYTVFRPALNNAFHGVRRNGIARVYYRGPEGTKHEVSLCLEITHSSPTGFEWGYCGSGPHQLAMALLVNIGGRHLFDHGFELSHEFKRQVVAGLPDQWTLTADDIRTWMAIHWNGGDIAV
jgi:hypothetical protein